ncbi:hypothetical protein H6P81_009895 [Aristolochia fimbriata]|uniref:Uncharacterized protein n=1 Tax=Aristolochia fimbriata TaxID=158543 RepID=A0AAV7EMA0_ARIFI|nr:hypothetical protein H6P81_009895 [Aristolochia fimbriata]
MIVEREEGGIYALLGRGEGRRRSGLDRRPPVGPGGVLFRFALFRGPKYSQFGHVTPSLISGTCRHPPGDSRLATRSPGGCSEPLLRSGLTRYTRLVQRPSYADSCNSFSLFLEEKFTGEERPL